MQALDGCKAGRPRPRGARCHSGQGSSGDLPRQLVRLYEHEALGMLRMVVEDVLDLALRSAEDASTSLGIVIQCTMTTSLSACRATWRATLVSRSRWIGDSAR